MSPRANDRRRRDVKADEKNKSRQGEKVTIGLDDSSDEDAELDRNKAKYDGKGRDPRSETMQYGAAVETSKLVQEVDLKEF